MTAASAKPIVLGIDLGTTNTCVAQLEEGERQPDALENLKGDRTTPSVVYFAPGGKIVVGKEARHIARAEPTLVCAHIKREMATDVEKTYNGESYTPAAISAFILKKVVSEAVKGLGRENDPVKAVITVPANYPTEAKNATEQAGKLAGIEVIYLAQEPVAAAFGYSFGRLKEPENLLVYDLGGGTFDVTVVRTDGTSAHTIATAGEQHCGGANWDEAIVGWLRQKFEEAHPGNALPLDSPELNQMLEERAEEAKLSLSEQDKSTITVHYEGNSIAPVLTVEELEAITAHLLEKTLTKTDEVREAARAKGVEKIDKVLLVGGSSRMRAVTTKLREKMGMEPLLHQPDLAIAKGAAVLAHMIETGQFKVDMTGQSTAPEKGALVTMVNPKSLGLEVRDRKTGKDYVCYVIPRNHEIPASCSETFALEVENQQSVLLSVFEERAEPSPEIEENTLLHSSPIDLPAGLSAGAPIEVTFRLDSVGFLHIFVKEPKSGRSWEVAVERYKKVSEEDVRILKPKMAQVA